MGAPFEKALHLKNVGQAPAVFTFEGKHVPPGVVISPQRGSVGPGGTQEVMVEYTAPKSQLVEATLVAEVRCGKPVKLAMAAEACVPEVAVAEDELDFGGLVVVRARVRDRDRLRLRLRVRVGVGPSPNPSLSPNPNPHPNPHPDQVGWWWAPAPSSRSPSSTGARSPRCSTNPNP